MKEDDAESRKLSEEMKLRDNDIPTKICHATWGDGDMEWKSIPATTTLAGGLLCLWAKSKVQAGVRGNIEIRIDAFRIFISLPLLSALGGCGTNAP
ncbi:hypothetical protein VNO78_01474 [Psophocarpus tetragonolobus]|uniref:Uncharacterized protein n=1 Tax=Psophocarpus tetragonolobus TaxID=3891 RepID=A0AAN9XUN6_PSOTE